MIPANKCRLSTKGKGKILILCRVFQKNVTKSSFSALCDLFSRNCTLYYFLRECCPNYTSRDWVMKCV